MLGAIIGDIVGSKFEWNNIKTKEFEFFNYKCEFTDDSIMTLAIEKAILNCKEDYSDLSEVTIKYMQEVGRPYPYCGYGGYFSQWLMSDDPKPYNSLGNGAAMRVSAVGFVANSIEEAIDLSRKVTEITHNHPEGIKGAEATAVAVYRQGLVLAFAKYENILTSIIIQWISNWMILEIVINIMRLVKVQFLKQ